MSNKGKKKIKQEVKQEVTQELKQEVKQEAEQAIKEETKDEVKENVKHETKNGVKKEGKQDKTQTSKKGNDENEPINWKKEIISWALIVGIAFGLAFFITTFVIMKAEIVSGSMMPGLQKDDHVIGNRLAYLFSGPERGDVIFFEYPKSDKSLYAIDPQLTVRKDKGDKEACEHDEGEVYVKRVIGLPGETVKIVKGKVYINDSDTPLEEPYLKETPKGSFGPYTVPENCYFCLGDNRNSSLDSRYWDNPINPEEDPDRFRFVSIDAIYAKAVLKLPWGMHWIEHYRYEMDKEKSDE